jgi:hypothetical protein
VDWCTFILTNILYHRLSKKLLNIQVWTFSAKLDFLTKDTPWPGYAASLPVLGTV